MNLNFVLCPSYHGATLLALLLNNHSKISSLGDAIPQRAYDQRCACRNLVSQCEFWQKIVREIDTQRFATQEYFLPRHPLVFKNQKLNRAINHVLGSLSVYFSPRVWRLIGEAGKDYSQLYINFYHTVCRIHGTELFVEGSKSIIELQVLRGVLGAEATFKVLHVVRDPRGYWASRKKYYPETPLEQAAKDWKRYHGLVKRIGDTLISNQYFSLRYEDLCREPAKYTQQIFNFLGVENQDVLYSPAENPVKHHLMGNKMVFSFDGRVKYDETWKKVLPLEEQQRMLRYTSPLSLHFGYSEDVE